MIPMRCAYCDRYCDGNCGLARRARISARRRELEELVLTLLFLAAGLACLVAALDLGIDRFT